MGRSTAHGWSIDGAYGVNRPRTDRSGPNPTALPAAVGRKLETAVGRHRRLEQRRDLRSRERAAEVKALGYPAALGGEELGVLRPLDALGDDVATARVGELQDRRVDRGALRVLG